MPHQAPPAPSHSSGGVALWGWRWEEVDTFLVTSLFLLTAALVKLAYHHTSLHHHLPESCILIILGTVCELISFLANFEEYIPRFQPKVFFFLLLPPIILESAYSLHDRIFFANLGTILLYAVVGTLINIFLIGPSLWLVSLTNFFGRDTGTIPLIECLVFSTLISAVDPVAVLAIFQEIGVNKALYFLVFGESLLNDAVVITVYNVMTVFAGPTHMTFKNIILGIVNFFTVSGGGLLIGSVYGVLTAVITKFTSDVRVIEPMIVIVIAYMSYVTSELFHFSGIIGIIACGLIQVEYARYNISQRSFVTIKYFTKNLSTIADCIIFFFLGKVLVRETHVWSTTFALMATLFCVVYRFLSVFFLTYLANNVFHRVHTINLEEQLVMAYGGLRGAIAFSLSISINQHEVKHSKLFVSGTLFVILFTVVVLGSTTKTIVRLLRIKTDVKQDPKMFLFLTDKLIESTMTGIEDITGNQTYFHWISRLEQWNEKYLKSWLVKGWVSNTTGLTETYKKVRIMRPKSLMASIMQGRASIVSNISVITTREEEQSEEESRATTTTTLPLTRPYRQANGIGGGRTVNHPPVMKHVRASETLREKMNEFGPPVTGSSRTTMKTQGSTETRNVRILSPRRNNYQEVPRWSLLRNVVNFTNRVRNSVTSSNRSRRPSEDVEGDYPSDEDNGKRGGILRRITKMTSRDSHVTDHSSTQGSRKQSLINLVRGDSQERELNEVRRTINSALTRTSFYHLPGTIFIEDVEDEDGYSTRTGTTTTTGYPRKRSITTQDLSSRGSLYPSRSLEGRRRRSSIPEELTTGSRTTPGTGTTHRTSRSNDSFSQSPSPNSPSSRSPRSSRSPSPVSRRTTSMTSKQKSQSERTLNTSTTGTSNSRSSRTGGGKDKKNNNRSTFPFP